MRRALSCGLAPAASSSYSSRGKAAAIWPGQKRGGGSASRLAAPTAAPLLGRGRKSNALSEPRERAEEVCEPTLIDAGLLAARAARAFFGSKKRAEARLSRVGPLFEKVAAGSYAFSGREGRAGPAGALSRAMPRARSRRFCSWACACCLRSAARSASASGESAKRAEGALFGAGLE